MQLWPEQEACDEQEVCDDPRATIGPFRSPAHVVAR